MARAQQWRHRTDHGEPAVVNRTAPAAFSVCRSRGSTRSAYVEWGPTDADHVVICVHGLTRQGRDFDYLASELAARGRRVICPDLVGRGRSGWLRDPADYTCPAILRRHERPHRPHGRAKRRLGRHIARRPDRDCAGGPSRQPHPAPRHQRHRPGRADQRPSAHRPVRGRHAGARSPRSTRPSATCARSWHRSGTSRMSIGGISPRYSVREDPEQGVYLTLCDPAILQALKAPSNPGRPSLGLLGRHRSSHPGGARPRLRLPAVLPAPRRWHGATRMRSSMTCRAAVTRRHSCHATRSKPLRRS